MKKKVMFVIPSLAGGGAEKVLVDIITNLNYERYEISLILFEKKGQYLSLVPDDVKIYDLKKINRLSFFRLIFLTVKVINRIKPDSIVGFMSYANLVTILSRTLSGSKANLIITIHNCLTYQLYYERFKKIKHFLYKRLFKFANVIVCTSKGVEIDLVKRLNLSKEKIKVIYNPLDLHKINRLKNENPEIYNLEKYIISVGRLTKQKGFPYLLRAYASIHNRIEEKLVILGEGKEGENLRQLSERLGIKEKTIFLGFQNNPYKFMKNASIFVLSSLWEGFGIVIVEAMACRTPVISTDCPFGPGEIITNGKNGILVSPLDEKALAEAMLTLLGDRNLRKKFSEEGKRRAEDFRIEKILPQYEELF